ncbi:hypothetical protein [Clostridium magnum]|uniref:Uncharacterized protein n=1 Tax=Clostridium magnum DSM 2767 TaxID=1121326 RepID=A0A162SSY0_9CLOT|nr:hypothetical protein [Clostridium magnum]KZL91830.1 hypothetical protein CLMAG_16360 [Clostridium magnum DSM 2767]SHI25704.1 hypothetical protein SAMN02745944_03682 [Clostridium magnum DSM 2767]
MVKKNYIKILSDDEVIDTLDLYKKDAERLMRQLKAMDRAKIEETYSEDGKLITKIVHETEDHIVVDEIVFDDSVDDIKYESEQIQTEVEADKTLKSEIIGIDNKIQEFLKQMDREIDKLERDIQQAKKDLIDGIKGNSNIIANNGLSKGAETITKLTFAIDQLYTQKQRFEYIFKFKDAK